MRISLASAGLNTEDFDEVITETSIIDYVHNVLLREDINDFILCLKGKAFNVCCNLMMSSNECILELFQPNLDLLNFTKIVLEGP